MNKNSKERNPCSKMHMDFLEKYVAAAKCAWLRRF